jgi:AraC family transcriptional regulator of arabinose operon
MDPRIIEVIEELEARLHDKISFEDLAAQVGLSPSRLARLFKAATGQSAGAYLQTLRMTRAHQLLARTSLSVREIMAQVGITDPSRFARDFRNAYGLSPRAFRHQLRLTRRPTPFLALVSTDTDAHR